MNRTFAARGVLISFVVLAGLAGVIWWLIASGRIDGALAPSASKAPADQSKPLVSAPAPEKPASAIISEASKTLKDLGDRLGPPIPAKTDPGPAFDVARIEPNGEAVIAGRAIANSSVELLVDGKVHDRTTADASGAFVFVPKPLPAGKYDMTLRATAPDGTVMVSKSPVAVALLGTNQPPVAALVTPTAPPGAAGSQTQAASPDASKSPAQVASRPSSKEGELRIESVEPEAGGGLFVSGRAAPGARVRLYMNDGYIAMGTASPEGRVAFSIRSGVRPGDYRIRLDQMSASDGVASRVEMPFRAPATVAAPAPAQTPASPAAPDTVVARQPERETTPAASAASPSQPSAVTPAATPSQPATAQPAAPAGPAPGKLASGSANEPLARSAGVVPPSASPVTNAQLKPDASRPVAPAGQQNAQSPVTGAPGSDPKMANNTSPRVAGSAKDRRDAVVIPRIDTRMIVRGDNLWRISEATYGLGKQYTVIFGANRDKIRDPDLIYPGQIFVLPKSRPKQ
jgi:nucleoid-associated protein YgaU